MKHHVIRLPDLKRMSFIIGISGMERRKRTVMTKKTLLKEGMLECLTTIPSSSFRAMSFAVAGPLPGTRDGRKRCQAVPLRRPCIR